MSVFSTIRFKNKVLTDLGGNISDPCLRTAFRDLKNGVLPYRPCPVKADFYYAEACGFWIYFTIRQNSPQKAYIHDLIPQIPPQGHP